MQVKRGTEREWVSAGYEGAERAMLHLSRESGRTAVVRIRAGTKGPRHRHGAGEHVLVLSGKVTIDGITLAEGDYCYTEAGEEHALTALEDSMIFVSSDKAVTVLETA